MSGRAENRTNDLEKRRAEFLQERARIDKVVALQKRREAAARRHWAVDGFVKQVVLAILKITSGRFEPCALFLEREPAGKIKLKVVCLSLVTRCLVPPDFFRSSRCVEGL